MSELQVVAKPWKHGWELHVEGVGVTQSRSLADAEEVARDYVALLQDVRADAVHVRLVPELEPELAGAVRDARSAASAAEDVQKRAAALSRSAVRLLKNKGLTGRDIAVILQVSPQRVSQLLR
ncbi:MAG TPA: hypothetical protein VGX23_31760 [Actinocrinis sp.]|nr:hypothetical protein [Actinocrinis sp.]